MPDETPTEFLADLNSGSPLELILRGHLWIEARLIQYLSAVVPFPDRVDFGRFTYPQKLSLAAAHGVLEKDDVPAYLKVNALRNKIAHRLDAALSQSDEVELVNCLSPRLRDAALLDQPEVAQRPWPDVTRFVLAAMILVLDAGHAKLLRLKEEGRRVTEPLENAVVVSQDPQVPDGASPVGAAHKDS
ncbi:hypothetical protein [Streptomyces sp. CBMA29]|uniref:hypothetical protein n=1 Tax=Streptomyces sp. CBMA29 TaxID=1896314 RepID=UPI00166216A2|nr:hypothetical protein [Streptomyces sp. CBMA29]MBD0736440.1 hypothetical protein [Streptomyces sp. CBMA29]